GNGSRLPSATRRQPRLRRARRASRPNDLGPEAPPVALEQSAQLGSGDERYHDVADRMRGVEPEAAAELDRQRGPGVRVEAVPLPDVHQPAEGEAEDETEERERNAASDERRSEGAGDPAAAPGQHLPRRAGGAPALLASASSPPRRQPQRQSRRRT